METVYEDDLTPQDVTVSGPIAGLLRILAATNSTEDALSQPQSTQTVEPSGASLMVPPGSRVIVAAADNYLPTDELDAFFKLGESEPLVTFNGYKDLRTQKKFVANLAVSHLKQPTVNGSLKFRRNRIRSGQATASRPSAFITFLTRTSSGLHNTPLLFRSPWMPRKRRLRPALF